MAQLDVRRTYADGSMLLKQDLDAFVDDIETFINLTRLNDDNFLDAGITASSKVTDATITNAKFEEGSITTAKILDLAVTAAKIANSAVTTAKIADTTVTTTEIAAAAISTVKIADANITYAKLIASNLTTGYISTTTVSTTPVDITSISITTTGRPVFIGFMAADATASYLGYEATGSTSSHTVFFQFLRDSTTLVRHKLAATYSSADTTWRALFAPGLIFHIDVPAAGTYTYKLQGYVNAATTRALAQGRLVAYEL